MRFNWTEMNKDRRSDFDFSFSHRTLSHISLAVSSDKFWYLPCLISSIILKRTIHRQIVWSTYLRSMYAYNKSKTIFYLDNVENPRAQQNQQSVSSSLTIINKVLVGKRSLFAMKAINMIKHLLSVLFGAVSFITQYILHLINT